LCLATHRSPHWSARRSVLLLLKIDTLTCFSRYASELYAISIRRFVCLQSGRVWSYVIWRGFEFSLRSSHAVFYSFHSKSLEIFVLFLFTRGLVVLRDGWRPSPEIRETGACRTTSFLSSPRQTTYIYLYIHKRYETTKILHFHFF